MNLFDLHCDTAGECFNKKLPLYDGDLHINICKGKSLDEWAQVFAIWIPDELRGSEARKYFENVLVNFKKEISRNTDKIKLCQGIHDFEECRTNGKCAAFLACEGASPFAGNDEIYRANELGVKLITLTWNAENEIGYGCQSGSDSGLKSEGKALLKNMEKLGIVADVSHLNRAGFFDVVSSGVKVVASHSNSKNVLLKTRKDSEDKFFACRRNLDDEQIKLLIECKGLIGINFCRSFLGDIGDDGFEAIYRHISHILEMGGENVLALGSDFDGCEIVPELSGVDKITDLHRYLHEKGFSSGLLDKIFFENAEKFFKIVLQ
ncbi:MAG: membrane dipeptidase [Acutalibacteraceae bacterium]|nr:membrane dipeptidase [Acutalibacteraceae bacterium]